MDIESDINSVGILQELATEQAISTAHMDAESEEEEGKKEGEGEEEKWPQLMMFGCGELEADGLEY